MSKVFVTGPDGVLGSNIVRELLARKYGWTSMGEDKILQLEKEYKHNCQPTNWQGNREREKREKEEKKKRESKIIATRKRI